MNVLTKEGVAVFRDMASLLIYPALTVSPREIVYPNTGMPVHLVDFERATTKFTDGRGELSEDVALVLLRGWPEVVVRETRSTDGIPTAPAGWKPDRKLVIQDEVREMVREEGGYNAHVPSLLDLSHR